ncbi:gluconolactonase [Allostella vacuolata]|nr:gluconolactonase [Stella vacuolata]
MTMARKIGALEIRDPRLTAIVDPAVRFEPVASGCIFTEGPLWHPDGFLLFSDMPGDHLRRWSAADGVTTFRRPCNKSNGLAWDRQGRLLACEHATSRVTRTEADGTITVLATHHEGRELNSPNDLVVGRDGAIYFSDPTYGRMEHFGVPRQPQLDFRGVFRIDPAGTLRLLADDFGQPNGLCFSHDGTRLFVNDTDRQHIRVFDVGPDGALAGGRVWAVTEGEGAGAPDGMKIDSAGNLYCCGPGGIHVFAPDATCLGVIQVPEYTANFAWGDSDYRSLFITASTSVYRIRVEVPGTPQLG